jgi:SepF-like predicted cell division protein (DUF552 family)
VTAAIAGLPITQVKELKPYFNLLVYGESGVGKTWLAGSADGVPEMRRVLFIDIEGGTLTLRNTPFNEVEVIRVLSWRDMENIYNELSIGIHGFNTIIIDSLTEIQKMSMDGVMRRLIEENEERDADVPGMREWNINIEQTRKFVRRFRDLPVNTIFTALAKTDKNMRTGSSKRKPYLSGKVADEVAGFLDIVVYLYTKEVGDVNKRMLLTGQTEDTIAKDRSGRLDMVIEEPTMLKIFQQMYLKKETVTDAA